MQIAYPLGDDSELGHYNITYYSKTSNTRTGAEYRISISIEKVTKCILRQPEMLHLETRIYFTLSSVVLYEFPQYEFPQAVRLYEFPQPVPVLDLASMVHVLQYR